MRRATHCASTDSGPATPITSTETGRGVVELAPGHQAALFDPGSACDDGLDRAQNLGAAAEVVHQFHQPAAARLETSSRYSRKPARLGVAEAEDRLVDVADCVESAGRAHQCRAAWPAGRWCPGIRPSGCGRTGRARGRGHRDGPPAGAPRTLRGRRNRARRPGALRSR